MLFKFKNEATNNAELNEHNNKLEQLGLYAFEHRLVAKLATFAHKIVNNSNAPCVLKSLLKPKHPKSQLDTEPILLGKQRGVQHLP
jgi:hypothetical protein